MKRDLSPPSHSKVGVRSSRLRELTAELQQLEAKLRLGGGPDKIEKQHSQGKLTARERIDLLLDKDVYAQEIGLLVAYDQYKTSKQQTVVSKQQTAISRQQTADSLFPTNYERQRDSRNQRHFPFG